ncbi:hypothetical protein A5772_13650 [Mycolicibacter sinensis]|uniref:Uncharacterized protein n=1 Tax=Mycolicibacter sinensis (strain JDM601) TaxID=875328 RepID=A0A1A2E729_MYCSD|nr:hypothetical protein A5772_13650 [Mycolicibacter sinensis]OBG00922.1 hypothetical protein A5771_17805 [Mycolicibacter sinensis]
MTAMSMAGQTETVVPGGTTSLTVCVKARTRSAMSPGVWRSPEILGRPRVRLNSLIVCGLTSGPYLNRTTVRGVGAAALVFLRLLDMWLSLPGRTDNQQTRAPASGLSESDRPLDVQVTEPP